MHKGANYGYSEREGNETLLRGNITAPLPAIDKIPVQVGSTVTDEAVAPTYPVLEYGHVPSGGDAIGSGNVYNGRAIPALRGKFIFTDISTGHVWYADYKEMLAADDGDPKTMAPMHDVWIRWNMNVCDHDVPDHRVGLPRAGREGSGSAGPGHGLRCAARSDVRLGVDAAGELYLYSKTDGMIRQVISVK